MQISVKDKPKYDELISKLSNRWWRLNNLYYIQDAEGNKVKFTPNWAQRDFYSNIWYFNVILKARQLGFSTFILIYILDILLFNPNKSAGVIAQGLNEAQDLFKNKVKFAYDNLPEQIRQMVPAVQDSARSLKFANGSGITVGTSLRGGTFQYLHVSEYGKIASKYPDKAKEIKTGALNTVHLGQQIFIESTAEGQEGEFYELCQHSQGLREMKSELTAMDPKFHFYPWWKHPGYELEGASGAVNAELKAYFEHIESINKMILSDGQRAWYAKKKLSMGDDMLREFPSTPEESFETSIEGCYYNKEMAMIRKNGQVCSVPWIPKLLVDTWWDLGINDEMCITFFQRVGQENHIIDYYENSGEGFPHYAAMLKEKPYTYGEHLWPHDGDVRELGTGSERWKTAQSMGIKPIKIIDRSVNVSNDIEIVRNFLPTCWFDGIKCDKLIKHLGNYRREWNDRLGVWREKPRHDAASNGADSFRTGAVGFREKKPKSRDRLPRQQSWEDL